jgi:hypothetical protein
MKTRLRITKWTIAWLILLMPILYVLNAGPVIYCCMGFGLPNGVYQALYTPVDSALMGTWLSAPLTQYETWWSAQGYYRWP